MATGLIIDENNDQKYKDLVGSKRQKAFNRLTGVHLTAATLAYNLSLEPKEVKNGREILRLSVLSELDLKVLRQIALAYVQDPNILSNNEKMLDVVNNLANAGISELHKICTEGGDQGLVLTDFVRKQCWEKSA